MDKLPLYMAPLQGVTEAPFRNIFDKHFGGVDTYYTPFVRWEHGGVRKKDLKGLDPASNQVKHLVPQLMAASAAEAEMILSQIEGFGYKEVDLNMGCAFPAVAKKGKGCGIQPYPEKVKELLQIAERHPELSFSVKMRLGYENAQECLDLLPILNAFPLSRVVVHARIGKQQYHGDCDEEAFACFARSCSHPVIYNGDVTTVETLARLSQDMPFLQGVMVGRGLLAAPWMAAEYREGKVWDADLRKSKMRSFHADLFDYYAQTLEGGEKQLLTKMKEFWEFLMPDVDRKLRKKIYKSQRVPDYTDAVFQLLR
ncbi:MAG: tRNA-dihydrouridine synthase family protein [Paraprevotella sp.]|nr:tRNA-dihydrouridine synthase family protein [Paraprevotella sp.]